MAPDTSGVAPVLHTGASDTMLGLQNEAGPAAQERSRGQQQRVSVYDTDSATSFDEWRTKEYPALSDTVYLDHAASQPAPLTPLHTLASDVASALYSNPHSRSTSAQHTRNLVDKVRSRVLNDLFGIDNDRSNCTFDCIFTSGATASMKLVADGFDWSCTPSPPQDPPLSTPSSTRFIYFKQSHTSLVGIRGVALARNATVIAVDSVRDLLSAIATESDKRTLVAYPAQCNVTGARLGLDLCRQIKRLNPHAYVLLDAAAYLSTSVLNLTSLSSEDAPDFVACSFYKVVGWPTGLGALIVKRSAAHAIAHDPYFGGGTISAMSTSAPFWVAKRHVTVNSDTKAWPTVHDRFEAGTVPYLDIVALSHALDHHHKTFGSQYRVAKHASRLAECARAQLTALRHWNGVPAVVIHPGVGFCSERGPTVAMSIKNTSNEPIGHVDIDKLATLNGIHLRTGGLCNTGAWSTAVGINDDDLVELKSRGRSCWDDEQFDAKGTPLGLVRISFGATSSARDVDAFMNFVRRFFVQSVVCGSQFRLKATY
ncbi:hypothetical protein OIV83_005746 [Microbotryomycetes sp. JL201]|nr:hypothetical protein OIV83_005746 [Microbotryomycetes sp. JL201]